MQKGEERVIAYYSKTLSKSERNYCVTRKELVAVSKAVQHFHHYLYGRHFRLRTDHAALTWLTTFKEPEGQMARWIERLCQYDYSCEHRPGVRHRNADGLSRRPCATVGCKHCDKLDLVKISLNDQTAEEIPSCNLFAAFSDVIADAQKRDPDLKTVICWVESGQRPDFESISHLSEVCKSYWSIFANLSIEGGTLSRIFVGPTKHHLQTIVPKEMLEEVLNQVHGTPTGGHYGQTKTLLKVKERFYWIGMTRDIKIWCLTCNVCASRKGPRTRSRGELVPTIVGEPFEKIGIDVLGPFPLTEKGNRWVLVMTDYFTKWPEAVALPVQTAEAVAEAFLEAVVSRFGVPRQIHSDQCRNFESEVFQKLLKLLGARKTRTTPLHPQSDGLAERFKRTLLDYLAKFVDRQQSNWDKLLPLALLSYQAAVHETTKFTPAMLNLGRELVLPVDLWRGSPPDSDRSVPHYVQEKINAMESIREAARNKIFVAAESMKRRNDHTANQPDYQKGQLVWLFNPQRRIGRCPKLQCDWDGPYQVLRKISDLVYEIRLENGGRKKGSSR